MGARDPKKRLWDRVLHRPLLGRIRINFYPPGGEASIAATPPLHALSRRDWHWVYLQHFAEALAAVEEQEAVQLLVAARALAEDFVSSSYLPLLIGEKMPIPIAGAVEIVPEHPGGIGLTVEVVGRPGETPAVRLARRSPKARERVASSNLVLLVHVMRSAAHPLEQYEVFKKITLFAEYCERTRRWHDRATLRGGALYAVIHADIAGIAPADRSSKLGDSVPAQGRPAERPTSAPPARVPTPPAQLPVAPGPAAAGFAPAVPAPAPTLPTRSPRPLRRWDQRGLATAAGVLLWFGLLAVAFFPPWNGRVSAPPALRSAVGPSVPTPGPAGVPRAPAMSLALEAPRIPPSPAVASAARHQARKPAAVPDLRPGVLPRFRVVSGVLGRYVAEYRARALAEQGDDVFVRARPGDGVQLQYGAFRSWMNAEAEAWRLRAQGYTATIIPY